METWNRYDRTDRHCFAKNRNQKSKASSWNDYHTDRGGQYAGKEYRKIIKRADMRQSMSRAGDCYDNAFMESCFGTIKNELEMTEYKNYNQALKDIREYISYYNFERKHSAIEYQTPSQFEQNFNLN